MSYLIGIDGGGTKTLGVLTDENGTVLAKAATAATNPNDVTLPVAVERLEALCRALLEQGVGIFTTKTLVGGVLVYHGVHASGRYTEE